MSGATTTRVAVVVVTRDAATLVDDCLGSLRAVDRQGIDLRSIAVDCGSSDGTVALVRQRYPEVEVHDAGRNLGFAGGCNVGIRMALEGGADFVYLLNPDTEATPGFLQEALVVAGSRPRAAAVQSLLLLWDARDRVNSAGNQIHILGFGWCGGLGLPASSVPAEPRETAYASGAGVLLRASALRQVGLLDEELFLYHEDLELGWRLRVAGHQSFVAPRSIVYHKYEFSRNRDKYYYMERNRWLVLLASARLGTLLVLGPLLLLAELGLLVAAAAGGWLPQKLRAQLELLRPRSWRYVARGRRRQRRLRAVSDAEVFAAFTPTLAPGGLPAPVQRVGSALLRAAWALARPLIR